mmetsp:Transcript_7721/g.25203  ORF Transcript_7721/g.25203 Transcript_7721/m.25203 type:complete len:282 (-) Transcript_7721:620-1465(-)
MITSLRHQGSDGLSSVGLERLRLVLGGGDGRGDRGLLRLDEVNVDFWLLVEAAGDCSPGGVAGGDLWVLAVRAAVLVQVALLLHPRVDARPGALAERPLHHHVLEPERGEEDQGVALVDLLKLLKVDEPIGIRVKVLERGGEVPREHRLAVVHGREQRRELALVDGVGVVPVEGVETKSQNVVLAVHAVRQQHGHVLVELDAARAVEVHEAEELVRQRRALLAQHGEKLRRVHRPALVHVHLRELALQTLQLPLRQRKRLDGVDGVRPRDDHARRDAQHRR